MDCKSFEGKKIPYLYGELIPDEQDATKSHLESCSNCRIEFQRLKQTLELLKDFPEVAPSESCLANIRRLAGRREAGNILQRLREVFTLPGAFGRRPAIAGAIAVVAIVLVSFCLLDFREPVTSLEWEDPFFEQKIAQVEESIELMSYDYDTGEERYELDTFEDTLDAIEEELDQLMEEIESV